MPLVMAPWMCDENLIGGHVILGSVGQLQIGLVLRAGKFEAGPAP